MRIRKLEGYEEHVTLYGNKVKNLAKEIENSTKDPVLIDYIQQLAEACYKEGFKDGYRFRDWI